MHFQKKFIPDKLWDTPLFSGSAEFIPPSAPLAIAETESRLRRIKNMPSTGDATPQAIFKGMNETSAWMDKHLMENLLRNNNSPDAKGFRAVERAKKTLAAGLQLDRHAAIAAKAFRQIPQDTQKFITQNHGSLEETLHEISFALLLLKDKMAKESAFSRKRYLKKVYKILDTSMTFNSTTDIQRLKPVIAWIKSILEAGRQENLAYLDVGCAVSAGAPGVIYAASLLRQNMLCSEIHGVDVMPPDREFARDTLHKHRVFLYKCNMTITPAPRKYDAILLANMHRHLTREMQQHLLVNLAKSIKAAGRIFINWRFDDKTSPGICLKLVSGRLEIEAEKNCV